MYDFNRQLRNQDRSVRRVYLKRLKKDLFETIKPRPYYMPKFFWLWLINRILKLKK